MTREQCIEAMARAIDPDAFGYHPGIGPLASKWCEEMCQEAREQATAAYDAMLPHIQAERERVREMCAEACEAVADRFFEESERETERLNIGRKLDVAAGAENCDIAIRALDIGGQDD